MSNGLTASFVNECFLEKVSNPDNYQKTLDISQEYIKNRCTALAIPEEPKVELKQEADIITVGLTVGSKLAQGSWTKEQFLKLTKPITQILEEMLQTLYRHAWETAIAKELEKWKADPMNIPVYSPSTVDFQVTNVEKK